MMAVLPGNSTASPSSNNSYDKSQIPEQRPLLFDLLFLYIIDLNFFIFPSLGIVGSQPGSFLEGAVGSSFPSDFTMTWDPEFFAWNHQSFQSRS